jgi:hypothetical protein
MSRPMSLEEVVCVALPELPAGASPPASCTICSRQRVPPESDDGIPPPHQWLYACGGGYIAEAEEDLDDWQPCWPCYRVTTEQALARLREANEAPVIQAILDRVKAAAPDGALCLTLPRHRGAKMPETCPSCGASEVNALDTWCSYACGAGYDLASTSRGPDGRPVSTSFAGNAPCSRPSTRDLLRSLRDRNDTFGDLAGEALDLL